ncbi:MAG: hypothetical protein HYV07_09000 [Deltaproteobacteria bacterium]|nr:hypothetical protein [Deltaproteobacteria bacterium]
MTTIIGGAATPTVSGSPIVSELPSAPSTKPVDRDFFEIGGTLRKSARAISGPAVEGVLRGFPVELSELRTEGRWATGFQLDGGSLRSMWMGARRVLESDGMPGVELFFWLSGGAADVYAKRMTAKGAKSVDFPFFEGYPPDDAEPNKSFLKRTGNRWSPSGAQVLQYVDPGKCCVDLCTGNPEALRGAMRIRIYGSDEEASKALASAVKALGLQSVFAPPNPGAEKRLKLTGLLTQLSSSAAERLAFRPLSDLDVDVLTEALGKAGQVKGQPAFDELEKLDWSNVDLLKRASLMRLLFETSAPAFLTWARSLGTSSPASGPTYSLDNALGQLNLSAGAPKYLAALASASGSAADGPKLMKLALLGRGQEASARALLAVEPDSVKQKTIEDELSKLGVDPTGKRVSELRLDEVYPGYFSVVDPALPEECRRAGARYLYSTLDSPERVWQALTGGQKSSLTRFQEGMLVQGKSSNSDFGTGGAVSVFTRLVTESAIEAGQKFQDWSGSRPFKLVLSRQVLGRTDWYGYNGDRFGRTTGLTDENRGLKLCGVIDARYVSSNELCFPVGNDPAFVDYVVCDSESRRNELISYLKSKGIESHNGKPVEELVRVATQFFVLPDDQGAEHVASKAARAVVKEKAKAAADAEGKSAAGTVLTPELRLEVLSACRTELRAQLESSLKAMADSGATHGSREAWKPILTEKLGQLLKPGEWLTEEVIGKVKEAGQKAAVELVDASTWVNEWGAKDAAGRAVVEALLEELAPHREAIVSALSTPETLGPVGAKAADAALAAVKNGGSGLESRARTVARTTLQVRLTPLLTESIEAALDKATRGPALEAAKAAVEKLIEETKGSGDSARLLKITDEALSLDQASVVERAIARAKQELVPSAVTLGLQGVLDTSSTELSKELGPAELAEASAVAAASAQAVPVRELERSVTEAFQKLLDSKLESLKLDALEAAKAHFAKKNAAPPSA